NAIYEPSTMPLPRPATNPPDLQATQVTFDFLFADLQPEHLTDTLVTQADADRSRQLGLGHGFDNRAWFTTHGLQDQGGQTLHGLTRQLPVHAAFEAVRSVGVQTVVTGLAGNGDRVEEGTFQEQVGGV